MRIPSSGTIPSGLDIRVANSSSFYIAVPCDGGILNAAISGTPIPEISPGVYALEYWRPSGILPTFSVVEGGNITTAPPATFAPVCNQVDCIPEPIPTMGEWALLIFGLLILNISVVLLQRKKKMMVG